MPMHALDERLMAAVLGGVECDHAYRTLHQAWLDMPDRGPAPWWLKRKLVFDVVHAQSRVLLRAMEARRESEVQQADLMFKAASRRADEDLEACKKAAQDAAEDAKGPIDEEWTARHEEVLARYNDEVSRSITVSQREDARRRFDESESSLRAVFTARLRTHDEARDHAVREAEAAHARAIEQARQDRSAVVEAAARHGLAIERKEALAQELWAALMQLHDEGGLPH